MRYVRNAWYVAGWSGDLAVATPLAVTILNERLVLYRTAAGKVVALEDRCVHRLAPLSLGQCEGDAIRCMYHGLLFGPDGKCREIPGQEIIPVHAAVKSYAAVDRHSWLWIWMGDPAKADEALIPAAVGLDDPRWILGHGQLDYAAEARLINDNLLDFTHLSYVHPNSFGASEEWARGRPEVIPLERGVRFQRWLPDQIGMAVGGQSNRIDIWSSYDFMVPGILLMQSANFEPGTAQSRGRRPPDAELMAKADGATFTSQAVTPITEHTARYFFSWGPRSDWGNEGVRDELMAVAANAFAEDKRMIEAQQQVIIGTAVPRVMPTSADRGVLLFNRLVDRLLKAEGGAQAAPMAAE